MRRPRLGPRIADSLLYASGVIREAIAETLNDSFGDEESALAKCGELETAAKYMRQLATWYRRKEGVE